MLWLPAAVLLLKLESTPVLAGLLLIAVGTAALK
jgi:hypothetical protein